MCEVPARISVYMIACSTLSTLVSVACLHGNNSDMEFPKCMTMVTLTMMTHSHPVLTNSILMWCSHVQLAPIMFTFDLIMATGFCRV